jgi:pimeloyl-ACP methyl ester carboxylesterase
MARPMDLISVRSSAPGLTVLPVKEFIRSVPAYLLRAERLIVLIHGYQNSADKAERSYHRMEKELRFLLGYKNPRLLGTICGFLWPGDHDDWATSVGTYNVRVPIASTAGERLAALLASMHPSRRITLVGHSLGCRVIMHAIASIRDCGDEYTGAIVDRIFLLAAAVPAASCEKGQDPYGHRVGSNPSWPQEYVFHSLKDKVLSLAFRPGERTVHGINSEAVGRRGMPNNRWTNTYATDFGHGDYWSADLVAGELIRSLGYIPVSTISETHLLSERLPGRGHRLAENTIEQVRISSAGPRPL